ncbi:MAG: thioredoxin domain-containing protein [Spirochaetales bacterium]|nr:thioredoxin domain-containing protein [Spirochaetales bacterium]
MKMFTVITAVLLVVALPLFASGEKEESPAPMMEGGAMEKQDDMMDSTSGFVSFIDMEDAMKKAESKPTVLFFEASWCPSCQAARSSFESNGDKLNDVYVISVDYDHSADLQTKYGVTYQHTYVQISPDGEALVKWNGGATEDLLANIQKGGM